jgi:hypothetical protein
LKLLVLANPRFAPLPRTNASNTFLGKEQCAQDYAPSIEDVPDNLDVSSSSGEPAEDSVKVCEVTDESGVVDQFFNQAAYKGLQASTEKFGWENIVLEPHLAADYVQDMTEFIQAGCDLIVLPTGKVYFSDAIRVVAEANPDQKFQVFDFAYQPPLENVWAQVYATDQASFLPVIWLLHFENSKVATLCIVGGLPISWMACPGYYYNEIKGAEIEVLGWEVGKRWSATGDFQTAKQAGR